ncbi:alpha/beta hydrolase [Glycomyces arizonensis]|uniref:alpha/beta hydrolase n=1 Tax=Glycomyces arizonensis TaxID=256035 RepID=UPI0012EC9854|nr:alpha/beta hydrolase [Glycomyces arizonensis]
MRIRWWRASVLLVAVSVALVYLAGVTRLGEAEAESLHAVPTLSGDVDAQVAELRAAAPVAGEDPGAALAAALDDPGLAAELVAAEPDPAGSDLAAALATLESASGGLDPVEVGAFFDELGEANTAWLSVLYPGVVAYLPGAPFEARIDANKLVIEAATQASASFAGPDRPWTENTDRPVRAELGQLEGSDREFISLDPYNNSGGGSWIELLGDLETASQVTVLVPGGSAELSSENFNLYYNRAKTFVDAAGGELAVVVWAGASWPSGWIEESWASWSQVAAESLASFTFDLRAQIGEDVPITLAGHSYGGAVIGLAETYELVADRVLHIASAGMGYDVYSADDLTEPCRPRYSITAPGDPISYVQGMPYVPLLGHGADPDDFPGTVDLATGNLSDSPDAVDDYGVSLAEQGILGKTVEGVHSHSEVFYPESDAWNNILAVMLGEQPEPADSQPEPMPGC